MRFKNLENRVRPKEHIELLRPLLPDRYSPLQSNGNGIQSVYLTSVPEMLSEALIALIGPEAVAVQGAAREADQTMTAANADLEVWEHHIESELDRDTAIPTTEREALIIARRGHQQIVDADLSSYFDTVPHAELMKSVARRVVDGAMLHLIKMWLEAPVEETDERGNKHRTTAIGIKGGAPAGSADQPAAQQPVHAPFRAGVEDAGTRRRWKRISSTMPMTWSSAVALEPKRPWPNGGDDVEAEADGEPDQDAGSCVGRHSSYL